MNSVADSKYMFVVADPKPILGTWIPDLFR
jgi:hypothetical protein